MATPEETVLTLRAMLEYDDRDFEQFSSEESTPYSNSLDYKLCALREAIANGNETMQRIMHNLIRSEIEGQEGCCN